MNRANNKKGERVLPNVPHEHAQTKWADKHVCVCVCVCVRVCVRYGRSPEVIRPPGKSF